MNNKNKILVGCLALLLVLSVGYALFSETIEINGTATAKGSFDISGTCQAGYSDDLINAGVYSSTNEGQGNYSADSCSVNGNSVSFSSELNAPGALRAFTIKMTNTGTIPATLDIEKTDGNPTTNKDIKICPLLEDGTASVNCTNEIQFIANNGSGNYVAISDGYQIDLVAIQINGNLCSLGNEGCGENLTALNTGDSIYYEVKVFWPSNYVSGYDYGFKNFYSFDVPFIQATE